MKVFSLRKGIAIFLIRQEFIAKFFILNNFLFSSPDDYPPSLYYIKNKMYLCRTEADPNKIHNYNIIRALRKIN